MTGRSLTLLARFFDFLEAYFGSNPDADVNDSGDFTVQDIFDYRALYFTGCGE